MLAITLSHTLIGLLLAVEKKLPPEKKRDLVWLILFVITAGTILIVVVMLMLRSWRRNLKLIEVERKKLAAIPDIWKEGGNRLIAKMSPFPKADPSDGALGEDDEDHPAYDESDLPFDDEDEEEGDRDVENDEDDDDRPPQAHG